MGVAGSRLQFADLINGVKRGDSAGVEKSLAGSHPSLLAHFTLQHHESALHIAASMGHEQLLARLIAHAKLRAHALAAAHNNSLAGDGARRAGALSSEVVVQRLVNAGTDRGQTALMLAAGGGYTGCVLLLLQHGADVWMYDNLGGRTALHYAARKGHAAIVKLLLQAAGTASGPVQWPNSEGTRYFDVRTFCGFSALHYAARDGHDAVVRLLVAGGANPLAVSLSTCLDYTNTQPGASALHVAATEGREQVAKVLLKAYLESWGAPSTSAPAGQQRMADPRLLPDFMGRLPHEMARARQHHILADLLNPSTSLAHVFSAEELSLYGPPKLRLLAGVALRRKLKAALQSAELQASCGSNALCGSAGCGCDQQQGRQLARASCDMHALACEGIQQDGQQMARQGSSQDGSSKSGTHFDSAAAATAAGGGACGSGCCCGTPERRQAERNVHVEICVGFEDGGVKAQQAANPVRLLVDAWQGGDDDGGRNEDNCTCGVCLDAEPRVVVQPCGHRMCAPCCRELLRLDAALAVLCPFCRGTVGDFGPALGLAC